MVVVGVVIAVVQSHEPEVQPATAEQQARATACTAAAQEKLQPLVTETSGKWHQVKSGTDWTVETSVNHKTKWADHWYDVTCTVGSGGSVSSVTTTARK